MAELTMTATSALGKRGSPRGFVGHDLPWRYAIAALATSGPIQSAVEIVEPLIDVR